MEREVEDRFFDLITKQKQNNPSNAFKVYQRLVFYRYEEIVKSTFLQFCKYVDKKEIDDSIYKFLENPPSTPFVWQIANDYRKFVKKHKLFHDRKYLYDLLYFDWIEVELYMKEYKKRTANNFSWKEKYKLSKSARIKKCNYDIINKNYKQKRENFLIIYYDFELDEVMFREINELIYVLIKNFNKKQTLEKNLKKLCKENDINFSEAKEILEPALKELVSKISLTIN